MEENRTQLFNNVLDAAVAGMFLALVGADVLQKMLLNNGNEGVVER
jgi:hypothetical protein